MENNEIKTWLRIWLYGVFLVSSLLLSLWPFFLMPEIYAVIVYLFVSFPMWYIVTIYVQNKLLK